MKPNSTNDETVDSKPPAHEPFARGTAVGRYLLLDGIGSGGMGVVYKAYDPDLDRTIALKLMRAGNADAGRLRDRLLREAQALAKLQHPNVVAVHDVGTFGGDVFVAMELVAGQTLRAWLESAPRRRREILAVFLAAGAGLEAAHRAGLVHRDFKPDNVIIGDDGRVRVLDFGLARTAHPDLEPATAPIRLPAPADENQTREVSPTSAASLSSQNLLSSPLTNIGAIVGTPRFMAPEQHLGAVADERADQFSFCLTLYWALYRQFPFAGDDLEAVIENVLAGRVSEAPHGSDVPRWLRQAIVRGLSRQPTQRWPSMTELLAQLAADPEGTRRRRAVVVASLLGAAVFAGGVLVAHRQQVRACAGASQKLAGVWDGERRARVHAAFVATGVPYAEAAFSAVAASFDRYAQDWVAMRTDACEATQLRRDQSEELLDLRMSCLDDRLTQLGTLTDVYASANAKVVEHASDWAASLPGLGPCADAAALRSPTALPRDAEARRRIDAVRHDLARAHALGLALKGADGLSLARDAVERARAAAYPPVEAEAELRLGELLQVQGDYAGAPSALHRGMVAAFASRADETAAEIAIAFVRLHFHLSQFPEAERWADLAEALTNRLQRKDELLGQIYTQRANVLRAESKYAEALAAATRGRELLERAYGPDDFRVAEAWKALGIIHYYRIEYPQSLDAYRKSLELQKRALGPDHPRVITALIGMADVYGDSGDHEQAIAMYRQALEAQLRVQPDNQNVDTAYGNMANDYLQMGQPREAYELLQKSLAGVRKRLGPSLEMVFALTNLGLADIEMHKWREAIDWEDQAMAMTEKLVGQNHQQYGQSLAASARAYQGLGKLDEAEARYRKALAIDEKVLGPKHPEVVTPLLGLGQISIARHDWNGAREPLERGLPIAEGWRVMAVEACDFRLALAEVEWGSGAKASARDLATKARAGYVEAGLRGKEGLAEATAWLAAHR